MLGDRLIEQIAPMGLKAELKLEIFDVHYQHSGSFSALSTLKVRVYRVLLWLGMFQVLLG